MSQFIFTSQQVQADVERKIHGNVSQSFFGSLNEAARWLLNAIDPYETKRMTTIENAVYDEVDKYYLPYDVKDNRVIDIRKQRYRTYRDSFDQVSNRTFDKYNSTGNGYGAIGTFTIESLDGIKFIRLKDHLQDSTLILNQCDNLTNNGTWNVYRSVSNLQVDKLNYLSGNGSLRFNVSTSTSGALEVDGINPINLTDYMGTGAIFTWLYLPNPEFMSNMTIKFGSDPLNYYSYTVIGPHNNTVWLTGWNLVKFPLDGLITTGNPNMQSIVNVRFELQTTGQPMYNCNIDNIVVRNGFVYEIEYYSSFLFNNATTGLWQATSYDLGDNINLGVTSYNLLMLRTAVIEAQEVRNSPTDVQVLSAELEKEMANYLASNKSEYIEPTESWYKTVDPTRTQFYQFGLGSY